MDAEVNKDLSPGLFDWEILLKCSWPFFLRAVLRDGLGFTSSIGSRRSNKMYCFILHIFID